MIIIASVARCFLMSVPVLISLYVFDDFALVVSKLLAYDHQEVDERPDATASAGDEHKDGSAHLAYIEPVCAQETEEETENPCYEPFLVADSRVKCSDGLCRVVYGASAFYAYNGVVVDFCSTMSTKHNIIPFKN